MSTEIINNNTIEQKSLKELKKNDKHLSIDEIDKKILKILISDARLSYREISRHTKLSTGTVLERVRKLEKTGIITGYSANIDSKKIGFGLTAIIELVGTKLKLIKAVEEIAELPNVYAIYHTTGNIDMIVIAKFKTANDLRNFLDDLYNKMEIQRSETRIVLNTVKEDFRIII